LGADSLANLPGRHARSPLCESLRGREHDCQSRLGRCGGALELFKAPDLVDQLSSAGSPGA
jgi:hypothetical protein